MNEVQMEKCTVCGNGVIVTEKIKTLNGPLISWRCDKCGVVCIHNNVKLDEKSTLHRMHYLEERIHHLEERIKSLEKKISLKVTGIA